MKSHGKSLPKFMQIRTILNKNLVELALVMQLPVWGNKARIEKCCTVEIDHSRYKEDSHFVT